MKDVDAIIVGQGIAGTSVAYQLIKAGKTVHVFDKGHKHASSRVAAGLVNPLTGRKFVLSWRYPELRDYAGKFYTELEMFLGIDVLRESEIIRSVHKTSQWNDWQSRLNDPIYAPYVGGSADLDQIEYQFNTSKWSVSIKTGMQVDLPKLIRSFRSYLNESGAITQCEFDYNDLRTEEKKVGYQGINAKHVIFCEGAGGGKNPLFVHLPFNPSKGEVFIIKSESLNISAIYKNHIFFIPLGTNKYWVGSYDRWKYEDELPTAEGSDILKERIANVFNSTYEIIDHLSAVRPTVKDRRPFMGRHPEHENVWICNGLGTKGALLAPYFSLQLVRSIYEGGEIDKEVDIARYPE